MKIHAVVMNPDFAVAYVYVKDASVNSEVSLPACIHQLVVLTAYHFWRKEPCNLSEAAERAVNIGLYDCAY